MGITKKIKDYLFASIPVALPLVCWPLLPGFPIQEVFLVTAVFAVLVLSAFLSAPSKNRKTVSNVILYLIIFNLVSHFLSFISSNDIASSLFGTYPRYSGFLPSIAAFTLFIILITRRIQKNTILSAFYYYLLTVFVIAAIGILQFFFDFPYTKEMFDGRIDSLLGNPNSLALYLLMALPIVLFLLVQKKRKPVHGIIFATLFFALIFSIILTGSRTAIAILMLNIFIFGAFLLREYRVKAKKIAIAAVSAFLLGYLMIAIFSSANFDRFKFKQDSLVSLSTRLEIWRDTARVVPMHPVLGFGHDQFARAFAAHSRSNLLNGDYIVDRAHNIWLDILAERGAVGFLSFLAIVTYVLYAAFADLKKTGSSEQKFLIIAFVVIVINYLLFMQMNFRDTVNEVNFWLSLGLLYKLKADHL